MKQMITSILLLSFALLNMQCGTDESIKTEEPNPKPDTTTTTTSDMTNPFNFQTKTVLLNSGYEMPIIGIGTFYLSAAQAE